VDVRAVGPARRLMTYYSTDDGGEADLDHFMSTIAGIIETEAAHGWLALSTSVLPMRQVRGGIFDTGSTRTSKYAAVVLYARA
jgi:hypothetical protein